MNRRDKGTKMGETEGERLRGTKRGKGEGETEGQGEALTKMTQTQKSKSHQRKEPKREQTNLYYTFSESARLRYPRWSAGSGSDPKSPTPGIRVCSRETQTPGHGEIPVSFLRVTASYAFKPHLKLYMYLKALYVYIQGFLYSKIIYIYIYI